MRLWPARGIVCGSVGENLTLLLNVYNDGLEIDEVEAHIDFDTNHLRVASVQPGAALDVITQNTFDNAAGTIDFRAVGILAASYPKSTGQPGWDARADFDRSGIVNISDFGLLAVNFLKMSPVTVTP